MKYIKKRKQNFIVPSDIKELNSIFKKNGHKLYIVGGALRDFLTGDIPKDYDLATDALPKQVINMLEKDYKLNLQGESFAVVVVYTENFPEGLELATFRKDISKGRNPKVEVGNVTIEDDIMRRDITFNSIFYDIDKREIIDLLGGEKDLNNKIVKMVGDPSERIDEDKLRILRIIRFATRYGSKIDDNTKRAILNNNDLSEISAERIWDSQNGEFIKGYSQAKNFQDYLDYLSEFNLWNQILPNLKINPKIKNDESLVIVLSQILYNNSPKEISKLPLPTNLINQILFLHSLEDFESENVLKYYKNKKRFRVSNKDINIWLRINDIKGDVNKFTKYEPTVTSEYVMKKYDLKPSPEVGHYLKKLEKEAFEKL